MNRLAACVVLSSMLTAWSVWAAEPKSDEPRLDPRPETKEPAANKDRPKAGDKDRKAGDDERAALQRDQDRLEKRIASLKKEIEELKRAEKAEQAERLQSELQQMLIKYAMLEERLEQMRKPGAVHPPALGGMPGMGPGRPGMAGQPGMPGQPGMGGYPGMAGQPGPFGQPGMSPGYPGMKGPMPPKGKPQPDQRTHLERALDHLRQAASELKAAGFPEVAGHVFEQSQQIEKELRPRTEKGDVQRALDELREEVRRLRRDLDTLSRHMKEAQ